MKKLYIILLIFPLIGFGQEWKQIFGTEKYNDKGILSNYPHELGRSVQQTIDGGYIICGTTHLYSNYSPSIYLIKTDENGNEEWSKELGYVDNSYPSPIYGSELGYSIQQTIDGGYIICGEGDYNYNENIFGSNTGVLIIKTDQNGNEEWVQSYEGNIGRDIKQTSDGGYIICGESEGPWTDVLLLKIDQNGNEEWVQNFGGEYHETGYSIEQTSDGGYILIGTQDNLETFSPLQPMLIKTNNSGELEWVQFFSESSPVSFLPWYGYFVQQTSDNGYVFGGSCSFSNSEGFFGSYLIKTNVIGVEEWVTFLPGNEVRDVEQTNDGGYVLCGSINNQETSSVDIYLVKLNNDGDEQWTEIFGGTETPFGIIDDENEYGYSIDQTSDGGFVVCGDTQYNSNHIDIFLLKTFGGTTSTIELPTPQSKRELLKTTNILGQENTTIKNQPLIEIYDDGSVEKKYIIE